MSSRSQISCEVDGCNSKTPDPSIEFFPYPKIKTVCDEWIKFCKKYSSNQNLTQIYICSLHFEETAYINEIKETGGSTILIRQLNATAVPTLYPPPSFPQPKLDPQKYGHIQNQTDLARLKISNKILERKLKNLEQNISVVKNHIAKRKKNVETLELESEAASSSSMVARDVLSKVFTESQIKLLSGNKKTNWSKDDLAIGCTIRYLSSQRFYNFLTNQLNFPLPADSSIRRFVSGKRNGAKAKSNNMDVE